jgi:hypothetical protein
MILLEYSLNVFKGIAGWHELNSEDWWDNRKNILWEITRIQKRDSELMEEEINWLRGKLNVIDNQDEN